MVCSFWPRQVGSASPIPCRASPMPATLPWPKIAQTPSMKRSPSSRHLRRKPAHHGLGGGKSDRCLMPAASSRASSHRAFSQIRAKPLDSVAPSRRLPRRPDCARQPGPRDLAKDRAADGEALDQRKLRPRSRRSSASSSSGASSPSTTMPRVRGSFRSIASTAFRHAASVLNGSSFHQSGIDAQIVEALNDSAVVASSNGADLRGDDLEQELQPVAARRVEQSRSTIAPAPPIFPSWSSG